MSLSRIQFKVKLYHDEETMEKMQFLSRIETALDHSLNNIPDDFLKFSEEIPFGATINIIMEIE